MEARPQPPHPKRATRTKAITHINHPSLSKLSQTVREWDEAQALQQKGTPPLSSNTRREEVNKQLDSSHHTNSNSTSHSSRRSGETRAKEEAKPKLLQRRCSPRPRGLHRLTSIRSSLQALNTVIRTSRNTWLHPKKKRYFSLLRSLQRTREVNKLSNQCTEYQRQRAQPLRIPLPRTRPHRPARKLSKQHNSQAMEVAANAGRTSRSSIKTSSSNRKVRRQAPLKK